MATFITLLPIAIGLVVGVASAALWARFQWLHVAPFIFALLVYMIDLYSGRSDLSQWYEPIMFGALYYSLGWASFGRHEAAGSDGNQS